jgi:tetratricopeptide (TPR) repeat protein
VTEPVRGRLELHRDEPLAHARPVEAAALQHVGNQSLPDDQRHELVENDPVVVPRRQLPRLLEGGIGVAVRARRLDCVVVEEDGGALQARDHHGLVVTRVGDDCSVRPVARPRQILEDAARVDAELGAIDALRGLGAPEAERAYRRAAELLMGGGPAAEQFPAHFGLAIYHGHRGDFDGSMRFIERLAALASDSDDSMRLQALHARWMNSLHSGRIDDAVAAADEGRAIYRPEAHHALSFIYGNHDPGVCALSLQALAFALRGKSVRAVTQMHEAIVLCEGLGHAASLAEPLTQLPWALQINGDAEAAFGASERALALEDEVVQPQFFGIARAMRGWALSCLGQPDEGVAELERALADELRASNIWAAMVGTLLAEVQLRHGRRKAARGVLDRMLSLTHSMPSYFYEPELLRVEAEWLRLDGKEPDATRLLLQSIETARQHGSYALAVRSALALARSPSAGHEVDLKLLGDLYERLPAENDTDYGREARAPWPRRRRRALARCTHARAQWPAWPRPASLASRRQQPETEDGRPSRPGDARLLPSWTTSADAVGARLTRPHLSCH